jgi:CRISPR-associated protein (TIGR02584 family)
MEEYRNLLVAVAGLTPQVITETLYYLAVRHHPPVTISEIHVLTTQLGKQRLLQSLLTPRVGKFYTLCVEYDLDATSIAFDAAHVHVLTDAAGIPLDDIRTVADNNAIADQILAFIRRLTGDATTRLYCSLAGGRKTQSVLLGFALQVYGRPQDRLLHVLVSEEVESHPDFFYPPKASQLLETRDGRRIDAHTARVEGAEIPYVHLRPKLFGDESPTPAKFDAIIEAAQQTLDTLPNLPPLTIVPTIRQVSIGKTAIPLQPIELVLYAQFAEARMRRLGREGGFLSLPDLDGLRPAILRRYSRLYGPYSGRVEALERMWEECIPPEGFRMHRSKINSKIRRALDEGTDPSFYVITRRGEYGATQYGLRLLPELIDLQEEGG